MILHYHVIFIEKNHQSHLTGSMALPKINVISVSSHKHRHGRRHYYGRGHGSL